MALRLRRVLDLVLVEVLSPQLAPLGASLRLPRPAACAKAGWAADVVELVGFVGGLPSWLHDGSKKKARTLAGLGDLGLPKSCR